MKRFDTNLIIKNGDDHIVYNIEGKKNFEELIFDYKPSRDTDYYYLRVEQILEL